jgi:hypothetical protein
MRVTTNVQFTFDTDDYKGHPEHHEFETPEVYTEQCTVFAMEVTEAFLHNEADLPDDHNVVDNGVEVHV